MPPVKSARRTRRIYPICFSPKYKTVSGRKSLISAGTPAFPAVSPATESAADPKTRKTAAKAPARRGRPPLAPELYVELNGKQYNITDVIDRAKADYRTTHKVGVQSCKVYVKPEEGTAYYVINKVSGKLDL